MVSRCCLECHGVGGPGAYPLETAAQVRRVARTMLAVVEGESMPPWSPVEGVARSPERPSDVEIARLRAWIEAGAPIDDATKDVAIAPVVRNEANVVGQWRVGDGWTVGATESRVMRSFQLQPNLEQDLVLGGWRMRPDAPGLVSMTLVASGDAALARALDERDASVGFRFTGDLGTRPAASLAGVGVAGRFMLPRGFAMRVPRGEALAFEMHADGRGRSESGGCMVEALAPMPGEDAAPLRVVEPLVVGAQGAARQQTDGARIAFTMPPLEQALDLAAITVRPGPYGAKVLLTAQAPMREGATRVLLRIDRYDVHLDRTYLVDPPVRLPRGTVLALESSAENETLALRSTPQAVLLVAALAADRASATVDAAPESEKDTTTVGPSAAIGRLTHGFLAADATFVESSRGLLATMLVPSDVFAEAMGYEPEPRTGKTDSAGMSWFEAVELANRLSERAGLRTAYRIEFPQRDGKRLVGGVVTRTDGDGWRLPDGDEWAATFDVRDGICGALWNWTFDREGDSRVVRGGCWADNPGTQGKSARSAIPPATRNELFGARFVRDAARRTHP